jgi:hypothetical protein
VEVHTHLFTLVGMTLAGLVFLTAETDRKRRERSNAVGARYTISCSTPAPSGADQLDIIRLRHKAAI